MQTQRDDTYYGVVFLRSGRPQHPIVTGCLGECCAGSDLWVPSVCAAFTLMKRQILCFTTKSRRGFHVPMEHKDLKNLKEEVDC